jgi:hypothetical protein
VPTHSHIFFSALQKNVEANSNVHLSYLRLVHNPLHPRVLNGQVCYIASFVYITNHILHTFVYGPLISLFSIQFSTTRTTERSHPLHFAALWALDANSHFKNCPCTSTRMASKVTGKQPDKQLPCLSLTCPSELFLICAIHGLPWLAR